MINMFRRVPLAWLNLTHNTRRFLVSVLGISFAVLLMLVELGFWRALLDSQTAIIQDVDADLILVSVAESTITDDEAFPIERIEAAKGVDGVAWAQPLYIRYVPFVWKNRDQSGGVLDWPIRAIAFVPDAEHPAFRADRMPGFAAAQSKLREPHTAELDDRSKSFYDTIRQWRSGGPSPIGAEREVGGQTLRITGLFRLGTDFTTDGKILISDRTLADYGPAPTRSIP